ncbi:uncharacterized protein LOC6574827 isoform X2 [Drosophila mojavensis]|uniref:uncharacterized protein LOC6574827 isoform X2 n=1 Tax=Drosophila mojavensis TaxID=7230 RepID=UPI001CD0C1D6|nr:uncharacterized protein LOC6574827 isoform X2 [Drosophila mojavensis]
MSEGLRFVAAYGWFLVLCALSTLYLQSQPGDVDACGDPQKLIVECFKDFPQKLLQVDKIAITKEDLSDKCDALNRGMECFDVYSKHCLQSQKLNMYENKIYRALRLFKKFCANENYQRVCYSSS